MCPVRVGRAQDVIRVSRWSVSLCVTEPLDASMSKVVLFQSLVTTRSSRQGNCGVCLAAATVQPYAQRAWVDVSNPAGGKLEVGGAAAETMGVPDLRWHPPNRP